MIFRASADGAFHLGGRAARCALGSAGVAPAREKREGDLKTPLGVWPVRRVLYRPDRQERPVTALPCAPIARHDGWCDAPEDPNYNRPVALPYPASAEALWRDDGIYDLVVVLGCNDDPVVAGAGSAIFLHLARPGYPPTQGCVALGLEDLLELLRRAGPGSALEIAEN